MPVIPERNPIADSFTGVVLRVGEDYLLATTALPGADVTASGTFVVRYGVRIHGKHWLSIVPGLVAVDYGTFYTGEEAWEFLLKHSNLYPRAEVFGYRENGQDEQMWVRQLDIALPPQPHLYTDAAATLPIASPVALIGTTDGITARLLDYLPHYDTLADWQSSNLS
ncbi:MAG: hypothetical protein SF123_04995 [Chloroflexota bacterium]|nr:hypothetical protein [Chloroflexota bacterium]